MKVFCVILILIPQLALADRCPDLSGKYTIQGQDGQAVHLSIDQDECLYISIERSSSNQGKNVKDKHTFALDGVLHPGSLGGSTEQSRSSARFVGGKLELTVASSSGDVISKETWQPLKDKSIEIKDMKGGTILAKKGRR
ncbi:MAG TPA: hypothetical protein VGK48_09200 [Terriglobia bacterium]|jgi:hypothetical protein